MGVVPPPPPLAAMGMTAREAALALAGRGEKCPWCGDTAPGARCSNCGAEKVVPAAARCQHQQTVREDVDEGAAAAMVLIGLMLGMLLGVLASWAVGWLAVTPEEAGCRKLCEESAQRAVLVAPEEQR